MIVEELCWNRFRNLKKNKITPCDGVNVIYGDNAQGKTNLLECIWVFTGGRSFRGSRDEELIAFGQDSATAELLFSAGGRRQTASLTLQNAKNGCAGRSYAVNEIAQKNAAAMVGRFCACVFAPVHLSLIQAGPGERRKFLDAAICQIRPAYTEETARYRRGLQQRNALLKEIARRPFLQETLDDWDRELAKLGGIVLKRRMDYLEQLQPAAEETYAGIASGKEALTIGYILSAAPDDRQDGRSIAEMKNEDFTAQLLDRFQKNRAADTSAGFTTAGPHRDDFTIRIDGMPAKNFGSQGQQRSAALALKLGEAAVLQKTIGEKPAVLFDDVMSELDRSRQDYLFNRMQGWQIFITCCEPAAVLRMAGGKRFEMKDGLLTEAKEV